MGDPGDFLMCWFSWNPISRLGSGGLTIPGASETKTQQLKSEAMNEPDVEATKTSLELGLGKAMGSTPVVGVSLIQETVEPTT